ncbi:UNVERIFIED_CONTAM: hypothetical protein PYX00_004288 [Menopon gallinae]|uniref:Centrosome-associated FAM110 C-terminal domain-containing protein n=1 Tax=Menopon gallinae TaxID=328185 RepID=A0AAW2I4P9_9NEOP
MRHPQATPLRTISSSSSSNSSRHVVLKGIRSSNSAKRKSAVELLQETKAFYVKSETVLDKKQELKPTRSPDCNYVVSAQPTKSPRTSQNGTELQDKLRILLDFDSKENFDARSNGRLFGDGKSYRSHCEPPMPLTQAQHKSLPDLHISPGHSSSETSESSYSMGKYGADSRSTYSSVTQPEYGSLQMAKSSDFRRLGYIIGDGYSGKFEFTTADPRIYASLRVTKSGEFISQRTAETQTYCWRRNSNTSSGNRSQHNSSSRHSQSADSGRQSQGGSNGLRTGRSGLPDVSSAPIQDTSSDSGAEDESPPLYRTESYEKDKKRPILRSKSDITYKYCMGRSTGHPPQPPPPPLLTSSQLERFFDHLGMDPLDYRELACHNSRSSSPVFFSSVSSIDSCLDLTPWGLPEPDRPLEGPSIVERNARIIKWLCNCRKAQTASLTLV